MRAEENLVLAFRMLITLQVSGESGGGGVNEGSDKDFLGSLPFFFIDWFLLALMLHRPRSPGSDAHHCLSLGIFSWPDSGSWFFLSCAIASLALAYLFFPKCLTWIPPSFQCHSPHSSMVTHSVLWHIITQTTAALPTMPSGLNSI